MTALEEFRATVREWLADNLSGDFADAPRARRARPRARGLRRADRVGPPPRGRRLDVPRLAGRVRRPRRVVEERVVFHEEYARAEAPARVSHVGEELLGPTLIALGTDGAAGTVPAADQAGRGAVVPGLLRARRRLGPRVGVDVGGARRRRVGDHRAEGVDLARARGPVVLRAWSGPHPGSKRHAGLSYLLVPMDQPGVEVRPIEQLTGGSEFNEVFFARRADRRGPGGRRGRRRLDGRHGDAGRSNAAPRRSACRSASGASWTRWSRSPGDTGVLDDPVMRDKLTRARIGLDVMRWHALRTIDGGRRLGHQARVGELAPRPRGAGHGGARRGRAWPPTRPTTVRVAAAVPVQPRGHDLRRLQRDPAQHHRRARARPAAGGTRVIPSHDLLRDKVVVVTAAAGTGIGSAVARRCLEEGAQVVVSDWHERRLAATASLELGVHAIPCDVTDEDAGAGPDRRHGRGVRPPRRDDQQRRPRRHPVGPRHDRRRVVPGAGRDAERHVPLHARGAAADGHAGQRRGGQQRVGRRLARAGGPGPLRGGEGGRHGPDPLRGDGRCGTRHPRERGGAEPGACTRSSRR